MTTPTNFNITHISSSNTPLNVSAKDKKDLNDKINTVIQGLIENHRELKTAPKLTFTFTKDNTIIIKGGNNINITISNSDETSPNKKSLNDLANTVNNVADFTLKKPTHPELNSFNSYHDFQEKNRGVSIKDFLEKATSNQSSSNAELTVNLSNNSQPTTSSNTPTVSTSSTTNTPETNDARKKEMETLAKEKKNKFLENYKFLTVSTNTSSSYIETIANLIEKYPSTINDWSESNYDQVKQTLETTMQEIEAYLNTLNAALRSIPAPSESTAAWPPGSHSTPDQIAAILNTLTKPTATQTSDLNALETKKDAKGNTLPPQTETTIKNRLINDTTTALNNHLNTHLNEYANKLKKQSAI